MPTLEEVTAWSNDQLEAELKAALPSGLIMTYGWDALEGYWQLTLYRLNPAGERVVEIDEINMDGRLALLNVYGQFWLSHGTPAKDSPWIRRHGELSRELITRKVSTVGVNVPDPEDLDPTEIDNMYKQET